jgi:hypothetical protein
MTPRTTVEGKWSVHERPGRTLKRGRGLFGSVWGCLSLGSRAACRQERRRGRADPCGIRARDHCDANGLAGGLVGHGRWANENAVPKMQCGGTACFHRSIEGFYVTIGGVAVGGEASNSQASSWRDLRRFFLDRIGIESPRHGPERWTDPGALGSLRELIRGIPWSEHGGEPDHTRRIELAIDPSREDETAEAWVPALLGEDGFGVLVWPNSD